MGANGFVKDVDSFFELQVEKGLQLSKARGILSNSPDR